MLHRIACWEGHLYRGGQAFYFLAGNALEMRMLMVVAAAGAAVAKRVKGFAVVGNGPVHDPVLRKAVEYPVNGDTVELAPEPGLDQVLAQCGPCLLQYLTDTLLAWGVSLFHAQRRLPG